MIEGLIRRRLLINFRADAEVVGRILPAPFRPRIHRGFAIVGICLIRLEQIRPVWIPRSFGISSENAAHRIAAQWRDSSGGTREGVFIPRRDTGSRLNHLAGGRLFPGEHHLADFAVDEDGIGIAMSIKSRDRDMSIRLSGRTSDALPRNSCFASLEASSAFFEAGSLGCSPAGDCCRFDLVRLEVEDWRVRPFSIDCVESSFFGDKAVFPSGSIEFDHALIMRDLSHRWHEAGSIHTDPGDGTTG